MIELALTMILLIFNVIVCVTTSRKIEKFRKDFDGKIFITDDDFCSLQHVFDMQQDMESAKVTVDALVASLKSTTNSLASYKKRISALQKVQALFRDPERKAAYDIIANGRVSDEWKPYKEN
jgi:hypothetical protein